MSERSQLVLLSKPFKKPVVMPRRWITRCIFILLLLGWWVAVSAQNPLILEQCGVPYFDPQNNDADTAPGRDTLLFTDYFTEDTLLKAFYVDINAFAGQQVDRAEVFAILPDSSRVSLGRLSFGNCPDCVRGFALFHRGELQVSDVSDRNMMDMWLASFGQPAFSLTGNLQTLVGVGRISGVIPFCAIGWQVEYSVFGNPGSTSTEFATQILCLEPLAVCPLALIADIDCQRDSLLLRAAVPSECFADDVLLTWSDGSGWSATGTEVGRRASGNLGTYYLTIDDGFCVKTDSIIVENPPFAQAGNDLEVCAGDAVRFAGSGGFGHFWEAPDGSILNDSIVNFANASAPQTGSYILHAFNAENCEDTDTLNLTVNVPPIPEIAFEAPCLGDSLVLRVVNDSAFAETNWTHPRGFVFDPPVLADFQINDAGIYMLNAMDNNGCQMSESVTILGSEPPDLDIYIEESCDSARVYLAPEIYDYQWSNGVQGTYFASGTGGSFQVTVTDAVGCATIQQIDIPEPDGPNVDVRVTQPFCPGDFGAVEFVPDNPNLPLIYSRDGGETYTLTSSFDDLPYGKYLFLIQDDLGCIQEFPVSIMAPDTMGVTLGIDTILEVRPLTPVEFNARTIGNIQLHQWLPEEIDTGEPTTSFIANKNLDVRIIVEDARGCRATDGFHLRIVLGEVFAPSAFSPNNDGVNDRFILYSDNGSGEIIERLRIYDRWGNQVFAAEQIQLNDENRGWDGSFEGKPAKPQVYVYQALIRYGNGAERWVTGDVTLIR